MRGSAPGRLYRASWFLAVVLTGLAAGFMTGHSLLLGRLLSWMLESGRARLLADSYPVFALADGRTGLLLYYAVLGLQTLAALAFLVVAVVNRRAVLRAAIAGLASPVWQAAHFASGFGELEARVLRSVSAVSPEVAREFVAWNVPMHVFYSAALLTAFFVLLGVPLGASRAAGECRDDACSAC